MPSKLAAPETGLGVTAVGPFVGDGVVAVGPFVGPFVGDGVAAVRSARSVTKMMTLIQNFNRCGSFIFTCHLCPSSFNLAAAVAVAVNALRLQSRHTQFYIKPKLISKEHMFYL